MKLQHQDKESITITELEDCSLEQTFECGQCFRWHKIGTNTYAGIAYDKPLIAEQISNDTIKFYTTMDEFNTFWMKYFDLHRDYGEIKNKVKYDDFLSKATEYGWGIRILAQEPWEALCSYLISQRNSIPRIKKTVESLSKHYGTEVQFMGKTFYTFPTPQNIVEKAGYKGLVEQGLGYRADYVYQAAELINNKKYNLNNLKLVSRAKAEEQLLLLRGVGPKVANCVLLFGLGHIDAFPIDVWIQRVIEDIYYGYLDITPFNDVAGIIQQYMFFYMRKLYNR